MKTAIRYLVFAVAFVVNGVVTAHAQEITSYRATMEDMRAFANATRNLKRVGREQPRLEPKTRVQIQNIEKSVADLESDPALRAALQSAGMTAKKYVMLNTLTFIAGMATMMSDAEAKSMFTDTKIPLENLAFFKRHAQEITALNKAANQ